MKMLVLNGPNINFLGIREPEIYGNKTYNDLICMIDKHAKEIGVGVKFYQSNHEGDLVDEIQKAYYEKVDAIIFNPAAYTHTSVAILDAVKAVSIPTVEVHISDVNSRDDFRQISYISKVAVKTICGMGFDGYIYAIDFLKDYLNSEKK